MAIIQGSTLTNIFSKLNSTAASIEKGGIDIPHIVYPYFTPPTTFLRGQQLKVIIYVTNVDLGASIDFGPDVVVSNIKYFRYNNGIREELRSISFKATEVECLITLPSTDTIPDDTALPITITNLNGNTAEDTTNFIISNNLTNVDTTTTQGNLILNVKTSVSGVGIAHKDGLKINDKTGDQQISILYKDIPKSIGGSLKIELRDNGYIPLHYFRVAIENNVIFVEKFDSFLNTLIQKVQTNIQSNNIDTRVDLNFDLTPKQGEKKPSINITNATPIGENNVKLDKINAFKPLKNIEVKYNSNYSNSFRYELIGVQLDTLGSQRIELKSGEINVSPSNSFLISIDSDLEKNLNKYRNFIVKLTPYYFLQLVSGGNKTLETVSGNSVETSILIDQVYQSSIDVTDIKAGVFGGDFKVKINVDKNLEWYLTTNSTTGLIFDWVFPVETIGNSGPAEITIRVKPNDTSINRSTVISLISRNATPVSTLGQITVSQEPKTIDFKYVDFWFDFDPLKNTGPFPNTKTDPNNSISNINVPYYTKEGSNELLRVNGSNRTNPISLYGGARRSQTSVGVPFREPLIFTQKTSANSLNEGEYFVRSVDGFAGSNFNPNGIWFNSNIDFTPIPEQITTSGTVSFGYIKFNIVYKINDTIGEAQVSYKLDKIESITPTFTTNPNLITAQVDSKSNAVIGFINNRDSVQILGKTKNGNITPKSTITSDRNIFSISDFKFYKNWKKPSYVTDPTIQLNYITTQVIDQLTPNIYRIGFTSAFVDGSGPAGASYFYNTWGVVTIQYKNNLGDVSQHIIEFPINKSAVYTESRFYLDPIQTYIDVNKSNIPIVRTNNSDYYQFKIVTRGTEKTLDKLTNYGYTPFEPAPSTYTIRNVELFYDNSSDRVVVIEPPTTRAPNNLTYGFTLNSFDINVYTLSAPVRGRVQIEYRNKNENIPNENPPPNIEFLEFTIIPNKENDPEPPKPPPPPTYDVKAIANQNLNILVDCNNSILSGNLPVLISANQVNKNNTANIRSLINNNTTPLNNGEFKIISVVSDSDNLNFNIDGALSTVNLVSDFLNKNYKITVTIEYKDDNSNLGKTSTTFNINKINSDPYVAIFTPDPSLISVTVDYENNILYVSSDTISISGIEDNNRLRNSLVFTSSDTLTKGTFKIKKVEGFVNQSQNLTNQIIIPQTGKLNDNSNITVYIDYLDSCGKYGTNVLVRIPVNRIAPRGQEVKGTLTPPLVEVFVDFRRSLVQRPVPFPEYSVKLIENEIGSTLYSSTLTATTSDNLSKSQFKILKVYDSSQNQVIERYDVTSPSTFIPFVKKMLKNEVGYVYIKYKDLSGKEGFTTLQFVLNRNQLPREFSSLLSLVEPDTQNVIVSDTFEIIDQDYDEIKNIKIPVREILSDKVTTKPLKYVKINKDEKLLDDSTYTINSVYAYEQNGDGGIGKFIEYIGFEINSNGDIIVLANEIRTNVIIKIKISYIDNYGNEGTRDLLARILPIVTPPLITRLEYPEGINAQDYIGYDQNFQVKFESEFATNVSIYVNATETTYSQRTFYNKYKPDDVADFNMEDLINRFSIDTGIDDDTFTFTLVLIPERLEPNGTILLGQIEVIEIEFNKSDIQIPRPFIITNLNNVIKQKFDFTVYKDEVAWYLNHYLHFDDEEPRLIANWERDDITFSEFEIDELGNEIPTQENPTLVLKMYEPLPEDISVNKSVWISKQRS